MMYDHTHVPEEPRMERAEYIQARIRDGMPLFLSSQRIFKSHRDNCEKWQATYELWRDIVYHLKSDELGSAPKTQQPQIKFVRQHKNLSREESEKKVKELYDWKRNHYNKQDNGTYGKRVKAIEFGTQRDLIYALHEFVAENKKNKRASFFLPKSKK